MSAIFKEPTKGDLLFELEKSSMRETDDYRNQVIYWHPGSITIRCQKHKICIQCKALVGMGFREEICTSLKHQCKLKELVEESIMRYRPVILVHPKGAEDMGEKDLLPRIYLCRLRNPRWRLLS